MESANKRTKISSQTMMHRDMFLHRTPLKTEENITTTRIKFPEALKSTTDSKLVLVKEEPAHDSLLPCARNVEEAKEVERDYKKLKLLKDPKAKKNATALLPETLRARLKPIGFDLQDQYFTIDKITRETMVSRLFMAIEYGGSMQESRPKLSAASLAKHGMDDFIYLPSKFQPEAPQVPGAPGLWLSSTPGKHFEKIMRVFSNIIRTRGPKKSMYLYEGQYEFRAANPPALTAEEWSAQSPKFHKAWANGIVKNNWGNDGRARILLRRELNREPQQQEVTDAIANKRHEVITADEVKAAYFRGEEKLGVLTMKCVGYDNAFQQKLHDTFPSWVAPPPKPKRSPENNPETEPTVGKKAKQSTLAKRRSSRIANVNKPKARSLKRKRDVRSDVDSESESVNEGVEIEDDSDSDFDADA